MQAAPYDALAGDFVSVSALMDEEMPNWTGPFETEANQASRKRSWPFLGEDREDLDHDTLVPEVHATPYEAMAGDFGSFTALMNEEMPNWTGSSETEANQVSRKRSLPFLGEDREDLDHDTSVPEVHAAPAQPSSSENVQDERMPDLPMENCLLGSILHVNAQLVRNDSYTLPAVPPTLLFADDLSAVPLEVVRTGDYLELLHDKHKFGRINKVSCRDLCPLWDQHLELRAFLDVTNWNAVLQAWSLRQWQSSSAIFEVELNVYSPRENADTVGKALSKAGIFLQLPIFLTATITQYNPQFLEVPGFVPRQQATSDDDDGSRDNSSTPEEAERSGARSRRRRRDALDTVLNSLSHNDIEHEIRADDSRVLKSVLLPHQQKAIDFIIRRESGNLASELTMWKENSVDADETFYQHVLTGAKRPQQDEVLSGIVADDMGLGKSLVILSRISTSSDRAKAFAQSSIIRDDAQEEVKRVNSRATLILTPSTLLIDGWVDEIRSHVYPGGLKFFKYLGPERHAEQRALFENDIIFTTYATVAREKSNEQSPLKGINWFRLVLDEAHEIRNRRTRQYEAVYALSAKHRWCLTGTPIQNTLDDLGSLISFLRVPILENLPTFKKFIIAPTVPGFASGFKNLQTLLHTICIRRTRASTGLPDPEPEIRLVYFSPEERAAYDELWENFRRDIQKAVSGRKAQVSSTALRCIHELRLFCNNGPRAGKTAEQNADSAETDDERFSMLEQLGLAKCAKCKDSILSVDRQDEGNGGLFVGSCNHIICHACAPQRNMRSAICEFCAKQKQAPDAQSNMQPTQDQPLDFANPLLQPSKLKELLADICQAPNRKCIVFSSWKKTLDIAAGMMRARNINYDMIHGSLTLKKRINVLNGFKSQSGPNILLMTLGTGAVGLNLAVASRIYLLEPQWNPFLEFQAMARALRIGQDRQVSIIRFITARTIEYSSVLNRQKTKTRLAGGGFGKDKLKDSLSYFKINPGGVVRDDSEGETSSESEAEEVQYGAHF